MKRIDDLRDIRSELFPSRPTMVQSEIVYDRDSPPCRLAAEEWSRVAATVDSQLRAVLAPRPVAVAEMKLEEPVAGWGDAWQKLGEQFSVLVPAGATGDRRPELIALLPLRVLADPETRAALWSQLRCAAHRFSTLVCLFLGPDSHESGLWTASASREWREEVTKAMPDSAVRLYLLGGMTNAGELVSVRDLAQVAAHALLLNIALTDRQAPRILTQTPREAGVRLGVLGASGQIASAELVAQTLSPRLLREVVESLSPRGGDSEDGSDPIPTTAQFLAASLDRPLPFDARASLRRGDAASRDDYDVPSLVGPQFRFTVDLAKATQADRLDDIPPVLWCPRLKELDAIVSEERVAAIATNAGAALNEQLRATEDRLQRALAARFAKQLHRTAITPFASRLADQIRARCDFVLVHGEQKPVEDSLTRLDHRVRNLRGWPSLLGIVAVAIGVAVGVWWLFHWQSVGMNRLWGDVLAAVTVVGGLAVAVALRWWELHQARQSRDDVLERIQRRAQASLCQGLEQLLKQFHACVPDHLIAAAKVLALAADAVRATVDARPTREARPSLLELPSTTADPLERIYRPLLERDGGVRGIAGKFRERCRELAEEMIARRVAPEDAPRVLREFLENEVLLRFVGQLDIWRLYLRNGQIDAFDEPLLWERIHRWSRPVLCGGGMALPKAESATDTFWIAPQALVARLASRNCQVAVPMNDRILAVHRFQLSVGDAPVEQIESQDPAHGRDPGEVHDSGEMSEVCHEPAV